MQITKKQFRPATSRTNASSPNSDLPRSGFLCIAVAASILLGAGCSHTRNLGWTTMDTAFNVNTEKVLIEQYKDLPGYIAANYTVKLLGGQAAGEPGAATKATPLTEGEKILTKAAEEVDALAKAALTAGEELRDKETNRDKVQAEINAAKDKVKALEQRLALARSKQNALLLAMGKTTVGGKPQSLLAPKDASVQFLSPKQLRNKIMNDLMWLVDADYFRTKQNLYKSRAQFGVVTDWMVLGTSAAGTLAGGEAIKSILAATSVGIVGARNSVNENLYKEKATEVIISQMNALRDAVKSKILQFMESEVEKYSLEDGLAGIHEYYSKGNEVAALTALYDGVVPLAQQARATLDDVKQGLAGKPEAVLNTLKARVIAMKTDAEVLAVANKIKTAMGDKAGFKFGDGAITAENARTKLNGAVTDFTAVITDAELKKAAYEQLIGAFNAALK